MSSTSIYSIYMSNVSTEVVRKQWDCVNRCLPKGWNFIQYGTVETHAKSLQRIAFTCPSDIIIFLDIDCIPLKEDALRFLAVNAQNGFLTGCVQRANHKQNDAHLYVGPFCMAFSKKKYQDLGSPTFEETVRADIGEELTYKWQEKGEVLTFLWPTQVKSPIWDLRDNEKFGLGTTYEDMFYHSFCIRDPRMHQHFVEKCNQVLGEPTCHGKQSNNSSTFKI